jgi:hypothetical protein
MRVGLWRMLLCVIAVVAAVGPAAGQEARLLPDLRYFRAPLADPLGTRLGAGLAYTNLLATQGPERSDFDLPHPERAAQEVVAKVVLGGVFPLLRLATWPEGGVVLVADGKVFARFRVEQPSRDDMGQDWFIGGGVEARHARWSGRATVVHRSSHLGDEFMAETGAERIEFGGESVDVTAAYDVTGFGRLYGGGAWIFRSYLPWDPQLRALGVTDRFQFQAGMDREWRPWRDQRFGLYAGADWQAAQRTNWRSTVSLAAGAGIRSGRSLRLLARFFDGPSPMGEFFLTPERYLMLELVGDF